MPKVLRDPLPTEDIPFHDDDIPFYTLEERNQQAEKALSMRYDALNQLIAQAEQCLKALKPPHDVWHSYNDSIDESCGFRSWELLGLTKHQGAWRLCHAYDYEANETPVSGQPLAECPIEVRLRAARIVRQLQEEIVKAKEAYVPQIDDAIKELTAACAAFRKEAR